jgi:TldD protein
MLDRDLTRDILRRALSKGGEYADLFAEARRTTSVGLEADRVESVADGADAGVGVRVLFGGHTAYGYTNDATAGGLRSLAA